MGVHHLGRDPQRDLIRVVKGLVRATLQNSSIGRAGLRVYDGGWIRIINGGLQVIGSAIIEGLLEITGQLTGSGQFLWTGPWELRGAGKITGNVTVEGNGKVRVGSMLIDPTVGGGSIVFDNGAQVFTNGDSIQVYKGNGVLQVTNSGASVNWGGNAVTVDGDGLRGTVGAVRSIGGTGHPANSVVLDSNRYFRVADGT